jgi:hypothetical protein
MEKTTLKNKSQKANSAQKETETPKVSVEVVPGTVVKFVSNGAFYTMPKGEEYEISSEDALVLMTKGFGEIKK